MPKSFAVVFVCLILLIPGIPAVTSSPAMAENLNTGPYINSILYKVMPTQDQRMQALQSGEVEMDSYYIDPFYYETLNADPDIAVFRTLQNGYRQIIINCRDWPLNETILRRAFAFAFNKTQVSQEVYGGFSVEHDSLVPAASEWCIEEDLVPHYYDAQSLIGNQLLDASGDFPIEGDFRTYRGTPFEIEVEYCSDSPISTCVAQIAVDALLSLHVNATVINACVNLDPNRLYDHGHYDMVVYGAGFSSYDVDWLAYEYWSENADVQGQNPTNFRNATYDSRRDQLLNSFSYDDVYEAAAEMQKILHEQVPSLVVSETILLQPYRTDRFDGHVEDLGGYIAGPWTMRKIHEIDGTNGGTVQVAIDLATVGFNVFYDYSYPSEVIVDELWSSLYRYGPDTKAYPDLATNLLVERHSDNTAVPEGHTRFTLDIVDNATWSDGTPLTASDVAFTFIYLQESYAYGNLAGRALTGLESAVALTPDRVQVEFNTESYWVFSKFAFTKIIPEHIFTPDGGIGYEGWSEWNPVFNASAPHVTCGPFVLADYEPNQWYELTWNPLFHYRVNETLHYDGPTSEVSPTTSNGWSDMTLAASVGIASASVVVILYSIFAIYKLRKSERTTIH